MSISVSLVAVFIPMIFMGGIMGRLFHEFAVTLTMAIAVSAVVSLTLTPMICGQFMRADAPAPPRGLGARIDRALERGFVAVQRFYALHTRLGAGASRVHAAGDARHRRVDRAALDRAAEGLHAVAGHRHADRLHAGLARRFVPGDGGAAARGGRCDAGRSRGGQRRLARSACRTAGARSTAAVSRQPETAVRTRHILRGGDRAAARTAGKGRRRADDVVLGAGPARRRPAGRRAVPVRGDHPGHRRDCVAGRWRSKTSCAPRPASSMSRRTRIAPGRRSTW